MISKRNLWYGLIYTLDNITRYSCPELWTPKRYCPACRHGQYLDCGRIFEEPPDDVVSMLWPYRYGTSDELTHQLLVAIDEKHGMDATPKSDRISDEMARYNALSPRDYDSLIADIRKRMGLSDKRIVIPRTSVGTPTVFARGELEADLIYDYIAILTDRAGEMLSNSGLTGFELYPTYTEGNQEHKLYTLLVTGDGGVPKIISGDAEWRRCPECGEWYVWGLEGFHQTVDEKEWDGSDFFHLAKSGGVYISERAECWLRESGLLALLRKTRLDKALFKPDLPKSRPYDGQYERNVSR